MNGMSIYAVDLLLIICISTVYSARPLTPYQRSFTPTRNISCSQCEMKVETDKSKSFIETDMYRRRCLDEPEIFFKPCIVNDKNRPRGCAKLTTYLKEPTSKGRVKEVTLMKRFCATEGAESEEIKCVHHPSEGGYTELCICGTNNCNSATNLFKSFTYFNYSFIISIIYMFLMNNLIKN